MDWQWKAFALTFATVFLAELGDKTQIATIGFAAKGYPFLSVLAGSAFALCLAALVGAVVGTAFSRIININVLTNVSGVLFIVMGLLILMKKI